MGCAEAVLDSGACCDVGSVTVLATTGADVLEVVGVDALRAVLFWDDFAWSDFIEALSLIHSFLIPFDCLAAGASWLFMVQVLTVL